MEDYRNTFGQNHSLPPGAQPNWYSLHATDQDMWDLEDEYRRANGLPLPFRAIFSLVKE